MEYVIYKAIVENVERNVLSFLEHDEVFNNKLTNNAIVGYVLNPQNPIAADNIYINPTFVSLFHRIVCETSPKEESFKLVAEKQRQGYIYIIDQRDKNYPNSKPVDIIGVFEIKDGQVVADSYKGNPNYQVISNDWLFQLPEVYCRSIIAAMRM